MASKVPVRVARPTAPPPDYRLDLSRRALAGFVAAGLAVTFLIFLSGLVMGVGLNLDRSARPSPPVAVPVAVPVAEAGP